MTQNIQLIEEATVEGENQAVINQILELVSPEMSSDSGAIIQENPNKTITYKDIAILVRNHRDIGDLIRALQSKGIPFSYQKGNDILQNPEIDRILKLLKFGQSLYDSYSMEAEDLLWEILAWDFWGIQGEELYRLASSMRTLKKQARIKNSTTLPIVSSSFPISNKLQGGQNIESQNSEIQELQDPNEQNKELNDNPKKETDIYAETKTVLLKESMASISNEQIFDSKKIESPSEAEESEVTNKTIKTYLEFMLIDSNPQFRSIARQMLDLGKVTKSGSFEDALQAVMALENSPLESIIDPNSDSEVLNEEIADKGENAMPSSPDIFRAFDEDCE